MSQPLSYGQEGTQAYSLYYRHSNRVTWPGVMLGGAAGVAIGALCSFIYAYGVRWIPFPKLDAILAIVFGGAVGGAAAKVMQSLKVRSVPVTLAVVLVATAVAYYMAWCVWLGIIFGDSKEIGLPSTVELITHPWLTFHWAEIVNGIGTWRMSEHDKEATKGTFLTLIWIAEAVAIFGGALVAGKAVLGDTPFCEACNEWTSQGLVRMTGAPRNPGELQELKRKLEAGDFSPIAALGPANMASGSWMTWTHYGCQGCEKLHTLTVKRTSASYNKKGQITQKNEKTILKNLLIGPDALTALRPQQAGQESNS